MVLNRANIAGLTASEVEFVLFCIKDMGCDVFRRSVDAKRVARAQDLRDQPAREKLTTVLKKIEAMGDGTGKGEKVFSPRIIAELAASDGPGPSTASSARFSAADGVDDEPTDSGAAISAQTNTAKGKQPVDPNFKLKLNDANAELATSIQKLKEVLNTGSDQLTKATGDIKKTFDKLHDAIETFGKDAVSQQEKTARVLEAMKTKVAAVSRGIVEDESSVTAAATNARTRDSEWLSSLKAAQSSDFQPPTRYGQVSGASGASTAPDPDADDAASLQRLMRSDAMRNQNKVTSPKTAGKPCTKFMDLVSMAPTPSTGGSSQITEPIAANSSDFIRAPVATMELADSNFPPLSGAVLKGRNPVKAEPKSSLPWKDLGPGPVDLTGSPDDVD